MKNHENAAFRVYFHIMFRIILLILYTFKHWS